MHRPHRSLLLVALLLLVSLAPAAASNDGAPEAFLESLDAAVEKAQANDAPILVNLYATWCGWCRKLDNEVFPSQAFRDFAKEQNLVLLRLDTEDGAEGTALKTRFDADSVPSTLILDPKQVKIAHVNGFAPAGEMVRMLSGQMEAWKTIVHHFPDVLAGDEVELQKKLAQDLYERGDGQRASLLFERLLGRVEPGTETEAWLTYLAADSHRLAGRYDRAEEMAAKLRVLVKGKKDGEQLAALREQADLLSFYIAQDEGDCPEAVHSLESFLTSHPESAMRSELERALDRLKTGDAACT